MCKLKHKDGKLEIMDANETDENLIAVLAFLSGKLDELVIESKRQTKMLYICLGVIIANPQTLKILADIKTLL